jgi:hypothetical protein
LLQRGTAQTHRPRGATKRSQWRRGVRPVAHRPRLKRCSR